MTGAPAPRWPLVYALGALQLVITLGWMAYADFQPKLLERFGLTAFTTPLALYLSMVGATLAPLVGSFSDRVAQRSGARAPVLVGGALLTGAAFIAVATTVAADPNSGARWLLLALIAIWIAAMTVLQTPALSLLPMTAPPGSWPVMAAPLVLATVLPTALWPVVGPIFHSLGGPVVFVLGGIAVVAGAFALRRAALAVRANETPAATTTTPRQSRLGGVLLVIAFGLGIASAVETSLASAVVPSILTAKLGHGSATMSVLQAVIFGASTVFAPVLGSTAAAAGTRTAVIASLVGAGLCTLIAPLCGSIVTAGAIALLMGGSLALHLDCALPCAFELLPADATGLSAGLYLGGVFAGSQLAHWI